MFRLGLLTFLVGVAGCSGGGSSGSDAESSDPGRVVSEGGHLYDGLGREIVLRGFNARVKGLFDVTFDDGRTALEPIPPFGADDCELLASDLGQNFFRLPVNWSGIEPERGSYDEAYIDRVLEVVRGCWEHGVYTLVDLHQDAYSKHIGEDGAPLWAIVPPPEELLEGPLTEEELSRRRLSPQVSAAFSSLFENSQGILDAYASMAAHLGSRLEGEPGVMGLELMNEPVVSGGDLDAFHEQVGTAVREAAPTLTLVFEPNALRNFLDAWEVTAPFPIENAVYAPHIYTQVFTNGWASRDVDALRSSVFEASAEASDHGTPLMVGEYGNDPDSETGSLWIEETLKVMDEVKASAAIWLYEEWSQGGWGLYTDSDGSSRGVIREGFARQIAHPFPQAIDGVLKAFSFDTETLELRVQLEASPRAGGAAPEHVLAAPRRLYPAGVRVSCDGAARDAEERSGRVRVSCSGTELVLGPR